jgi:hypothetical protein
LSSVDAELLRLAQARVRPSILAMAQFHVTGPRSFPLNFFVGAEWLLKKRRSHVPTPTYLAVTESSVFVFSARFGGTTQIIGPVDEWPKSELSISRSATNKFVVTVTPRRDGRAIELEAAEPGVDSERAIALLCGRQLE